MAACENQKIMTFFQYAHLPEHLQEVSKPFCELAQKLAPNSDPEMLVALRKLLESKDAAVRAALRQVTTAKAKPPESKPNIPTGDLSRLEFLSFFYEQNGIDPSRTDQELINDMFSSSRHIKTRRNSGTTRVLVEWCKWMRDSFGLEVVAVSIDPVWDSSGVRMLNWHAPLKGVRPRPDLVVIDAPLDAEQTKSVAQKEMYREWLKRLPFQSFEVVEAGAMR